MSQKIAFVCPIYDARNHFQFGHKLISSKDRYNIGGELYFVFSDMEQEKKFKNVIEPKLLKEYNFLILPEEERKYKSQVTIKKFYGLKSLKNQYEYIYTIDSETRFIKQGNFYNIGNEIWKSNNMLNANMSPDGFNIMKSCYKTLGIYSNPILKQQTGNYKYNIWFNEIPVYKCDLLDEFFLWLDRLDSGYKYNWMCFDYYIFSAFLIIEKGYRINRFHVMSLGGVIEFLNLFSDNKQIKINQLFKSHWTSSDNCITENTYLRFHLDRNEDNEKYHLKDFRKELLKANLLRYKTLALELLKLES